MSDDDAMSEYKLMHQVGTLVVECPRCGVELHIPIRAGIVRNEDEPGKVYVRTDSNVDEYWLHAFAHQEGMI